MQVWNVVRLLKQISNSQDQSTIVGIGCPDSGCRISRSRGYSQNVQGLSSTTKSEPVGYFPMTDILLIQPPIRDFYLTTKRTIPYGLACIAAALKKDGFSVEIFDSLATSRSRIIDFPDEMAYLKEYYAQPDLSPFALFHDFRHFGYSFEHIGLMARKSEAFLVGISSLFTAYSGEAMETARIVKKFHPHCKIVMGGHHPTELPDEVMKCEAVDYVLRGEGELSLPGLARAIREGADLESVPGIVLRSPQGTLKKHEPAIMNTLDSPLPAIHLLKHDFYQRKGRASMVVVASRGCPQKCSYCSMGNSSSVRYRRRSVESVLKEIEEGITGYETGFIDFEDENISMDRQWFLALLRAIKERFSSPDLELRAMNGLFPPTLDEEVVQAMKEAGFRALNLSLGTISLEQLRRFRRPDIRKSFEQALLLAQKYGLEAVGYIIVGAPGQDAGSSVRDLLYLAQRPVLAGVSVYYPSPGSEDYQTGLETGILPVFPSLMRSTALPISGSTTRGQSVTLLRLGRIVNFIKLLREKGQDIPEQSECSPTGQLDLPNLQNRQEIGKMLLAHFLHDGIIRGVRPDGQVFQHQASSELSMQFIEGIRSMYRS